MNASDLRLGNLIHWESKNGVTAPQDVSVTWVRLGNIDSQNAFCKDYSPIPLTEEWLLKFGFAKRTTGKGEDKVISYESKSPYLTICNWGDGKLIMSNAFSLQNRIELKTVHQLQNLYFALTQTELILK